MNDLVAEATIIATAHERQREWDYLCDLKHDFMMAARRRLPAFVLDQLRLDIYRQERVIRDIDAQLKASL